jgi:hypothetical protein
MAAATSEPKPKLYSNPRSRSQLISWYCLEQGISLDQARVVCVHRIGFIWLTLVHLSALPR